jgi:hypothetical protein
MGDNEKSFCKNTLKVTDEDCMIEAGIVNILGTYRTDTPYKTDDSKITAAVRCTTNSLTPPCATTKLCLDTQPCIEVKLQLAMFWTRSDAAGSVLQLQPRTFANDNPARSAYGGYVINDGSTYAPQMPWYMSHYCDAQFTSAGDALDPVCYADYLSTFNDGFNILPTKDPMKWPASFPWSVYPNDNNTRDHCQAGLTTCTLVMGAFDLSPVVSPVTPGLTDLQYYKYENVPQPPKPTRVSYPNNFLFTWFNGALGKFPTNFAPADFYHHFPWSGTPVTWSTTPSAGSIDLSSQAVGNPFLGQFTFTNDMTGGDTDCQITLTGATPPGCTTSQARADHFLYPRQCTLADLAATDNVTRLRACGLNYELHHNGWSEEWPASYQAFLSGNGLLDNQYGRTSFLFAGVPGEQLPVSYYKDPNIKGALSVYEQVHNASLFSLYLPIANEADFKNAFLSRDYKLTEFYHTLLMTNHLESDPAEFAEGIRGRTLWHDEYRTEKMYEVFRPPGNSTLFPTRRFAGAFDPTMANAKPFHNNTCDACHVRNGSGIPTNTAGTLAVDGKGKPIQQFMTAGVYDAGGAKGPSGAPSDAATDYTFTGQIRPMKLVFFDLQRSTPRNDDSVYSKPLAFSTSQAAQARSAAQPANVYYKNAIMNFYGDSFHVTRPGYGMVGNGWSYGSADPNRIVVKQADGKTPTPRINQELKNSNCMPTPTCYTYQPYQVNLGTFTTPNLNDSCKSLFASRPDSKTPWPTSCADINSAAIHKAIDDPETAPTVGFILLNGKRLGNLGAIEAIPNEFIKEFQKQQRRPNVLGRAAGEIQYSAGSRDGVGGPYSLVKGCATKGPDNCFIGRFGWLGDRVSLEDQVANAAFIEMNMTTIQGYNTLYPKGTMTFPIRYNVPNCGPADQECVSLVKLEANGDLLEQDVNRMASYARWLGDPTRSEFTASLPDVISGETIFRKIGCNTCHVIDKIDIPDPDDTMLTKYFRVRLATRVDPTVNKKDRDPCLGKACPFLSYLGTDLLMHDMGYLSQVGNPIPKQYPIRDPDGVIKSNFKDYVQKIRTPPLKGLRFNRFVTESQLNTQSTCKISRDAAPCHPACDFLLHDGRACDAIEAAFLHDGPAVLKLGVIDGKPGCEKGMGNKCGLNDLTKDDLRQLRAFLYSL